MIIIINYAYMKFIEKYIRIIIYCYINKSKIKWKCRNFHSKFFHSNFFIATFFFILHMKNIYCMFNRFFVTSLIFLTLFIDDIRISLIILFCLLLNIFFE